VRYLDALLCVAALLVAEWLVVALGSSGELAGVYEVGATFLSLVPFAMVLAIPTSVGGALLVFGLEHPDDRRTRALVAVPALALAASVAVGVSGGRTFTASSRAAFVVAVVAVAGVIAAGAGPALGRALLSLRRRRPLAVVAIAVAAVALCSVTNRFVLPRLYPAFHIGMALLTSWLAALAALAWSVDARRRLRFGLSATVVLLSAIGSVGAPERLRFYDNVRFVYVERAPILGPALQLMGLLAPPPPVEPGQLPSERPGRSLDLRERDILLITVDALRADHVGAYGYGRPITPAIDALAKTGVVFDAAYTATPHTSYAVTSLMTGKYMRPLLLQGVGEDSPTWADALRRYGYRTAAFYPPAVFFVDRERFVAFEERGFGFEHRKVEFASASQRVEQVRGYLADQPRDKRLFLWVHLFEPHEPYVAQPGYDFGDKSIDRYDSEIAAADAGVGELVRMMREHRPAAAVIVSADHGEEFGDHGGRYHGTTVYDEQVRVPLVVDVPGAQQPHRVAEPVSLVDLVPTVLAGLSIPVSPRIRGHNLGPWLHGEGKGEGFAFAETDEQTLLARGSLRLLCARRVGACRLFDVEVDPAQTTDRAADHAEAFTELKRALAGHVSSLGRYEDGETPWPRALRRGIAGDVDSALDVAALLDDANVRIRRRAAEVLFELRREEVAPHLRRALREDEDTVVKRWVALALTRLGQGAPLTFDLLVDDGQDWRRLAALALAEAGDDRGERELLSWWRAAYPKEPEDARETIDFERARELVAALAKIRSEAAVGPLTWGLRDVRLRRYVAKALAGIGEEAARPALAKALRDERYHDARVDIARALVALGGEVELRKPLIRFLGVPDPMEDGLAIAADAKMLRFVGGPRKRELRRLRRFATSGLSIGLVVPESEHATGEGLRVLVRARATDGQPGEVRFGLARVLMSDGDRSQLVPKSAPEMAAGTAVTLEFAPSEAPTEVYATMPKAVSDRLDPGNNADFVLYATQNVEVLGCAVVPLAKEVPPPSPVPWKPRDPPDGSKPPDQGRD
jgi:arylsulfatase A-like enzyme